MAKSPEFRDDDMDSWKKEEYDAAIVSGALVLDTPTLTADEMFYYAGGSIRMIQWSVERVIMNLIRKMKLSPDVGKLIGAWGVRDSSESVVNSLMAIYDNRSVVLSKFVAMKMLDSVSDDVVEKAKGALRYYHHPWQELVAELEVLHLAHKRHSMLFRNEIEEYGHSMLFRNGSGGIEEYGHSMLLRNDSVGTEEYGHSMLFRNGYIRRVRGVAAVAPWQFTAIAYFLFCIIGPMSDGCYSGLVGAREVYPRVL